MRVPLLVILTALWGRPASGAQPVPEANSPLELAACEQLLGTRDVSRCWSAQTALGRATVVYVEGTCYADSCNRVWIVDEAHGARPLPKGLGWDGTTVAPSLAFAITDASDGWLVRVDLRPQRLKPGVRVARCRAPVLSPDGHWIVCRGRRASVLRAPVAGGPLSLVYRWPESLTDEYSQGVVEFPTPKTMQVPTTITGDWGRSEHTSWRE